jgi:hypothetical protein
MLPKSNASPCIVTLMLSFVLSIYYLKLVNYKLKTCIINANALTSNKISNFKPTSDLPRNIPAEHSAQNHTRTRCASLQPTNNQ